MIQKEAWFLEMASDDETLLDNKWLTVKQTEDEWVYLETPAAVAVLPFRFDTNFGGVDFLVRFESVPTMGEGLQPWCISGGIEEHGTAEAAAIAELFEEGGFKVKEADLIDLGETWTRKDVSQPLRVFAVDVTGLEQSEPLGDGSEYEQEFELKWLDWYGLVEHPVSILHTMAIRLYARLYQ